MALIQCTFFSEVLNLTTAMNVIVPQDRPHIPVQVRNPAQGERHPVLFLLHGMTDNHTAWLRNTSIERYAEAKGLAVVMPEVDLSFYTDMAYGNRYWTFISEELPALARTLFPLTHEAAETFVAGLSMGGYGAFKLALRRPEMFAAAASLSGAVNMAGIHQSAPDERAKHFFQLIFGSDPVAGTDNDLLHLAKELGTSASPKPSLYQCCGTEDFLYEDNLIFRDTAQEAGFNLTYVEGPGAHEWSYWDEHIQRVLDWLPLQLPAKPPADEER